MREFGVSFASCGSFALENSPGIQILSRLDPRQWNIAKRLFAGFGLGVAFTVCACLIAWSNFHQSERAMRAIELETISGMINALKTASAKSVLSALAPDLSRVVSDTERASVSNQLDEQMAKIRDLLDNFQADQTTGDLKATIDFVDEIDRELRGLNERMVAALAARNDRKMAF
ncbi:MAG: hypothetical protein ACR2P3_05245 [Geminicoccaceae bacterium]